ncbi:MAG TPA: ABC transporter permease, partial [Actinomycetota bacterium]|nr:ABC transporter permease [Actinomycetota bacterium]
MSIAAAIGDTLQEDHKPSQPSRKGKWVPYLLMLPGILWLAFFFVVPIFSLFLTSLQTPVVGGQVGQFEQTFNFANYWDT